MLNTGVTQEAITYDNVKQAVNKYLNEHFILMDSLIYNPHFNRYCVYKFTERIDHVDPVLYPYYYLNDKKESAFIYMLYIGFDPASNLNIFIRLYLNCNKCKFIEIFHANNSMFYFLPNKATLTDDDYNGETIITKSDDVDIRKFLFLCKN